MLRAVLWLLHVVLGLGELYKREEPQCTVWESVASRSRSQPY